MSWFQSPSIGRVGRVATLATAILCAASATAHAQSNTPSDAGVPGRIDFGRANLPPATVEVDLSQQNVRNLFNLGDAAVAGVIEPLLEWSESGQGSEGTRLAAEQLAAGREIIQLASQLVQEVRVRVYKELPQGLDLQCGDQLRAGGWETIVRGHDRGNSLRICTLQDENAVRGVFVVVGDGRGVVLVNVACEVSPEKVKHLTSAAVEIGLENGLGQVIEVQMQRLRQHRPAATQQAHRAGQH